MNAIEKLRDPSHVRFPLLTELDQLLTGSQLTIFARTELSERRLAEDWFKLAGTTAANKERALAEMQREADFRAEQKRLVMGDNDSNSGKNSAHPSRLQQQKAASKLRGASVFEAVTEEEF